MLKITLNIGVYPIRGSIPKQCIVCSSKARSLSKPIIKGACNMWNDIDTRRVDLGRSVFGEA